MRKLIITLICFLYLYSPAWSAIVCGSLDKDDVEADPWTLSFTPPSADGIVIGVIHVGDNADVTGTPTFDGGNMSTVGVAEETVGNPHTLTAVYWLANTKSTAQTFSVDLTGVPDKGRLAMIHCNGVNTSSPWRDAATTLDDFNVDPHTMTVTSQVGDLIVDFFTGTNTDSLTTHANQTDIMNDDTGGGNFSVGISTAPGVASQAMEWADGDTTNRNAHVARELVPEAVTTRRGSPMLLP